MYRGHRGPSARVEAYDDRGPALNALITINDKALAMATELDRTGARVSIERPLHCIPVILKDNFDTADMPTTGGSLTLARSIPPRDAFVVKKLRDAGAIVVAKANLTELARGGATVSALGGQTRNPYDLTRIGQEQVERNGVLSNSTGFPALAVPGGFSRPTASAPVGVPIGIELLGPEWSEPTLLRLAFAFEQLVEIRRPPASTPALRE